MTLGVRKLSRFFLLWAAAMAVELCLALLFGLGGALFSAAHLVSAAMMVLAALALGHLLMYRPRPRKVPVLMYHSVADEFPQYPDQQIVMTTGHFERQLAWLDRRGFQTLHLGELLDGLEGHAPLPRHAVSLTFDDGMLDNWVNVYPLLRRYGMKATLFVATDFIEEGEARRPNMDDVMAGRAEREDLRWDGYVNWKEIEAMRESGLVEFMPHSCSHDWAFTAGDVIDFHHPGDGRFWLHWLDHPEGKSRWLERRGGGDDGLGRPVYPSDRSMVGPAWIEDAGLRARCEEEVAAGGGRAFFERDGWRERLEAVVRDYRGRHPESGRLETAEEYRARVLDELQRCRRLIQGRTGDRADVFCWPGERFSDEVLRLAIEEAGYRAVTRLDGENVAGATARQVCRKISQEVFRHVGLPWLDLLLFKVNVRALEGNYYAFLLEFPLNRFKDLVLGRLSKGRPVLSRGAGVLPATGAGRWEGGA